jgi:hypothetical protein
MDLPPELTSTERVVLVLMRLLAGATPTTREVAEFTGLTPHGARKLLLRLCRVVPLTQVEGCWQLVEWK